jgi:hypothetical protein
MVFVIKDFAVTKNICMCCICCMPFIFFIGIAASTGALKGCQKLMKIWLITDCIVFAIS